ncbi:MAG: tripartite tricarboxylate transporter substrate binding protein, partial [Stackebrandtia sp.]
MKKLASVGVTVVASVALVGCGLNSSANSNSKNYPNGTVRIVVSYTAGGPTDLAARAVAPCLEKELDGTFVVENKPGGGGAIAMKEVAAAKPDGKTLTIAAVGNTVIAPMLAKGVGYTYKDFALTGGIYELPSVLTVPEDSRYKSAKDLIAAAKKSPGKIKVAIGGSKVYEAELRRMADLYDVEFGLVPFDGSSDAVAALLGGNVDALFSDAGDSVMGQVDAGKITALATGAEKPVKFLDGVPTFVSLGYEKLTLTANPFALAAPVKTPESIRNKLTDALKACGKDPEVAKRYG